MKIGPLTLLFLGIFAMAFFYLNSAKNKLYQKEKNRVGIYWGAFDPPTKAHHAIISAALKDIPLKKVYVIVNNHQYKNYDYPLEIRLHLLKQMLSSERKNIEIMWQDDNNKLNYTALSKIIQEPLCAIAGYDAYKNWLNFSKPQEREIYDAIAVVPRGDEEPLLIDENAFLLPIDDVYKYMSSTQMRAQSICQISPYVSKENKTTHLDQK